jgi:hypothetical protein
MPTLTIPNSFTANTLIKSADVDANFTAITTLLNVTKLDSTNVQLNGFTRDRLATGAASQIVVNNAAGNMSDAVTDAPNKLPLASQSADPATPASGNAYIYVKNKKLYSINDAGLVAAVGAGAGGGAINYVATSNAQPATNDFESDIQGWCGAAAGATTIAAKTYALTATMTIASPCVVTATGHGLTSGDPIQLTTSGALPTGLTAGTTYYAVVLDANTFNLAATLGGANINTSGTQSGTHTLRPQRPTTATPSAAPASTFSRSTSSPLRGTANGLLTKTAANSCGDAAVVPFTIDSADEGKVLQVSFDYLPSVNFVPSSGQVSSDSDVEAWIVDTGNSNNRIPLAPMVLTGGSTTKNTYKGTFQTATNSTTYQLVLIIASSNGNAWTMQVDNVQVGPQVTASGLAGNSWTAYIPTFTGLGSVSAISAFWRRVGDTIEVRGAGTVGTPTATAASVSLPSVSIDTAKISTATNGQMVGEAMAAQTAATAIYGSNTAFVAFFDGADTSNIYFASASGATSGTLTKMNGNSGNSPAGSRFEFKFSAPIAGWDTNTQMSTETDTRVVAAQIGLTSSVTPAINATIKYDTVLKDSHGSYNATTGLYTVTVPGTYKVTVNAEANGTAGIYVSKNGTGVVYLMSISNALNQSGGATITCVTGDTIGIVTDTSRTFGAPVSGIYQNYLSIERQSGPAAIAATESVNASYNTGAGPNITGTVAVVPFTTKDYDSHNAYNTSTGLYTCPVPGKYRVSSLITVNMTLGTGSYILSVVYKNGVNTKRLQLTAGSGNSSFFSASGSATIQCLAGDTLAVYGFCSSGSQALYADSSDNWICIERVGN